MRTLAVKARTRPTFFDLYRIKQPVTAVVSFGHRVSGVFVALLVPFLVYWLQLSLSGPAGWERAAALWQNSGVRAVAVLLIWAFAHHLFAGVRHLLFDIHAGTVLQAARTSAWVVLAAEAGVLILAIVAAW